MWTHLGVSCQHTSAGVDWVTGPDSSLARDGLIQPHACHDSQWIKCPSWPLTLGLTQSALAGRHRRDGGESPKPRAAALADLSFGLCRDHACVAGPQNEACGAGLFQPATEAQTGNACPRGLTLGHS